MSISSGIRMHGYQKEEFNCMQKLHFRNDNKNEWKQKENQSLLNYLILGQLLLLL